MRETKEHQQCRKQDPNNLNRFCRVPHMLCGRSDKMDTIQSMCCHDKNPGSIKFPRWGTRKRVSRRPRLRISTKLLRLANFVLILSLPAYFDQSCVLVRLRCFDPKAIS